MDLNKLEKLSCLNIDEQDKESYIISLNGVFEMMNSISKISANNDNDHLLIKATISELYDDSKTIESEMINRENHYNGIHLEQGVFLAPKVIKKN